MGQAEKPTRDISGLGEEVKPKIQTDFREQPQEEAASEVTEI